METHVKVVAWLYLVLGGLGVAAALLLWGVFGGLAGIVGMSGDRDAEVAVPILGLIGTLVFGFLLVVSLPSVIAGWGLLQRAEWARILTIILSALNLAAFPIGTALGAYGLYVLLNNQTTPLFVRGR